MHLICFHHAFMSVNFKYLTSSNLRNFKFLNFGPLLEKYEKFKNRSEYSVVPVKLCCVSFSSQKV